MPVEVLWLQWLYNWLSAGHTLGELYDEGV